MNGIDKMCLSEGLMGQMRDRVALTTVNGNDIVPPGEVVAWEARTFVVDQREGLAFMEVGAPLQRDEKLWTATPTFLCGDFEQWWRTD